MANDKATKYLCKIISAFLTLALAKGIQWFVVGHWGWQGYGKSSFYSFVIIQLIIAFCWLIAFIVEIA